MLPPVPGLVAPPEPLPDAPALAEGVVPCAPGGVGLDDTALSEELPPPQAASRRARAAAVTGMRIMDFIAGTSREGSMHRHEIVSYRFEHTSMRRKGAGARAAPAFFDDVL